MEAGSAGVDIRPAVEADLGPFLDLQESVAAEGRWIGAEAPIDRITRTDRFLNVYLGTPSARMFLADARGAVVGWADIEGPEVATLGMGVHKDHRGVGIGSRLLHAALRGAREVGAHKVQLEVWPHNDGAIELYEKAGFEKEGLFRKHYRRRNGELWDSLVMGLILDVSTRPPDRTSDHPEGCGM